MPYAGWLIPGDYKTSWTRGTGGTGVIRSRSSIRSGEGYVLGAVMAILAILLTLVAALQYQGMARRRNAVIMEAQYLAERSADNLQNNLDSSLIGVRPTGMPDMFFADDTITNKVTGPTYLDPVDKNSVFMNTDLYYRAADKYSAKLYEEPDFLGVGSSKNVQVSDKLRGRNRLIPPQSIRLEGHPRSWNPQYDLYRRTRFKSVYQAGFPYAAFAPGNNGSIEIEKVATWAQPAYGQLDEKTQNPLDVHSGLKPLVGANNDVTINEFVYGDAYSKAGKLSVKGGAVGFTGYLPYERWGRKSYFQILQESVASIQSRLNSVSTDKTAAVFGKLSFAETRRLVTKGTTPRNFLTYQAAAEWWFFMIPTVKAEGPSLRIRMHIPMPADTQLGADGAAAAPKVRRIQKLQDEIKDLQNQLLPDDVNDDERSWTKTTPGLLPKLKRTSDEFRKLERERDQLQREHYQMTLSGASPKQLEKKQKQINAKNKQVNKKRGEVERLDKDVKRKENSIATKKRTVDDIKKDLDSQVSMWQEGDPKGPDQTMDFLMTQMKVGGNPRAAEHAKTKPKKANSQKKKKDDKTALLSSKGMLFHSYAGIMVRLAAQFRQLLVNAVSSFPMRTITINLGFTKFSFTIPDFTRIVEWVRNIGRDLLNGLQNMFVYEVPLVYLDGRKLKPITSGNFAVDDTFNVPPGRTFMIDGNMTIKGDLWLQKGSSMTINGNLQMVRPGLRSAVFQYADMMLPSGRIYMEEGSSLVVTGNLDAAGDKYLGSVVACGPAEMNHGLSATIICNGYVNLPHGTGGGLPLEDLVGWAKGDGQRSTARKLIEDWAPNLSKAPRVLGPFQPRTPYFGRYPVTFRVFPPKPVPIPTFETLGQNQNVHLFRLLTEIFNLQLNLALGENFSTVCFWWGFGGEQVGIFPKSAAASAKNEISKNMYKVTPWFDWTSNFDASSMMGGLLQKSKDTVSQPDLIAKTVAVVVAEAANPDPTGASMAVVDRVLEETLGAGSAGALSDQLLADINPTLKVPGGVDFSIFESLKYVVRDIEDAVNGLSPSSGIGVSDKQERESANVLLVECPGIFVYGERHVQLGPSRWIETPSVRAVGCFASGGDVTANVRYTIGSLMSGNGRIKARELYYSPYFTRSSVYIPKALHKGGKRISANDDYWANAVNVKYGKKLDPKQALDIPKIPVFFPAAEGWGP